MLGRPITVHPDPYTHIHRKPVRVSKISKYTLETSHTKAHYSLYFKRHTRYLEVSKEGLFFKVFIFLMSNI